MIELDKPVYARGDGSYVATVRGMPFHVHKEATPAEWNFLQEALANGLQTQAEIVPDVVDAGSAEWILATIKGLEQQHMMSRPVREGLLASLQPGSAQHQRIKAVDDQIALLRQQLQ